MSNRETEIEKVLKSLTGAIHLGVLLQAEVAPGQQREFEHHYQAVTGVAVTPGNPSHYQSQPNKWGSELRVYFNDKSLVSNIESLGVNVEGPRNGYMSNQYSFRFNDNDLWWALVEHHGLRLGPN